MQLMRYQKYVIWSFKNKTSLTQLKIIQARSFLIANYLLF